MGTVGAVGFCGEVLVVTESISYQSTGTDARGKDTGLANLLKTKKKESKTTVSCDIRSGRLSAYDV